jgi:DNA adenine methylase
MKYMGSKNRHAKELLRIVLKNRKEGQCYAEPLVGGFNMIDKVGGNRIASDINGDIICLFKALAAGYIPPSSITEGEYKKAKNQEQSPLRSFIGFGCSYSGKWFGGYARGNTSKGTPRNYCDESRRNILKQASLIKGVEIFNCSYDKLCIPPDSIIYCDPPYKGTTKYKSGGFDHSLFWDWCRSMVKIGHSVFVSEYSAPEDFVCVWEKKVNSSLTKETGSKKNVERLFVHSSVNV